MIGRGFGFVVFFSIVIVGKELVENKKLYLRIVLKARRSLFKSI